MMKLSRLACASVIMPLTCLAAPAAVAQKWDMPMAYPASNFHSVNAKAFGDCVRTGSNGEIDIVTHPGGSLFKGNDIKRAVQSGQTQIGERLLSAHENENPLYGLDSIPFIATSYDQSEKLWQAGKGEIAKALDAQGLVMLYSVPWPPQGIYFKKEVNSSADMKGVRVRSYNNSTGRIAELSGMVPVQIEAAEITQALITGVIESLITSAVTGQDSKAWEQLSHFYKVNAMARPAWWRNAAGGQATGMVRFTCSDLLGVGDENGLPGIAGPLLPVRGHGFAKAAQFGCEFFRRIKDFHAVLFKRRQSIFVCLFRHLDTVYFGRCRAAGHHFTGLVIKCAPCPLVDDHKIARLPGIDLVEMRELLPGFAVLSGHRRGDQRLDDTRDQPLGNLGRLDLHRNHAGELSNPAGGIIVGADLDAFHIGGGIHFLLEVDALRRPRHRIEHHQSLRVERLGNLTLASLPELLGLVVGRRNEGN